MECNKNQVNKFQRQKIFSFHPAWVVQKVIRVTNTGPNHHLLDTEGDENQSSYFEIS